MENIEVTPKTSFLTKLVTLAICSIIFFGIGLWLVESGAAKAWLSTIKWFAISEVRINAQWPLKAEVVRTWLPPLKGVSLLTLDAQELVGRLEEKSWVSQVTLKKEYPGILRLDLEAKKAVAVNVWKGKPYFIDDKGVRIEKTSPELSKKLDLPVVTFEKENDAAQWPMPEFILAMNGLQKMLDTKYSISQIVLARHPYFRVYFSNPRWEVTFSLENWQSQLPLLQLLMDRPPRQIKEARRFNLSFPKKAVVSAPLSK